MRMSLLQRLLPLSLLLAAAIAPAAGALTVTGSLNAADQQMPVVFISSPNCTGQGVAPVLYEALPITVSVSGSYTFSLLSDGGFASLYLHVPVFDPNNGFPTCIAGDNSGNPVDFTIALVAGATYYAVPFDDTFDQLGGGYVLDITGPGEVIDLGMVQAIPTLSQWGLIGLAAILALIGLIGIRKLRHA